MLTSITDIETYMRCRRRWNLQSSSRGNLMPVGMKKPALELGTLIHAALAEWTTKPELNPTKVFLSLSAIRLKQIEEEYLELVGAPISDDELVPFYDSIELGQAMVTNYKAHWKTPLDKNFTFAKPEQEVIVNIPGTEHYCESCLLRQRTSGVIATLYSDEVVCNAYADCVECNGTGTVYHKLRAILDGLLRSKRGTYVILERKTFDPRYAPTEEYLDNNFQFTGYTWVVRQLNLDGPVAGIAYDGLRKQKAPGRTGKATSLSDLFVRRVITFTPYQLDEWGRNLAVIVNEMASLSDKQMYPHRRWEGCRDCGFEKLCASMSRGEDVNTLIRLNYVQRPDHRPKISLPQTDNVETASV